MVEVSDGNLTDTITVNISVKNINESPVFADDSVPFSIAENTGNGMPIGSAKNVAVDMANNQNTASETETVVVDMDAPTTILSVPIGVQNSTFSVKIKCSERVIPHGVFSSIEVVTNTAGATIGSGYSMRTVNGRSVITRQITPVQSGEVVLRVRAGVMTDAAGNQNTASETKTVVVDMDPPEARISVLPGVKNDAFDATITFTEAVSKFVQKDVLLSGTAGATITAWSKMSDTTYVATITPTSSGNVEISIPENGAIDTAGNLNTASETKTVVVDMDPPEARISVLPGVKNGAFDVRIVFTEDVFGFDQRDVTLSVEPQATITAWSKTSDTTY
jgi:hypothetical protein